MKWVFIYLFILLDFFWDNSININNIDSELFFTFFLSKLTKFLNNLNIFNFFIYIDNFLLILFIYTFFKTVLISSIFELIWPTQLFNKKNNISYNFFKNRSFLEFFIKIKNFNKFNFIINIIFFTKYKF